MIDLNTLSTEALQSYFLEQISENNFTAVKKILVLPNLRKQLETDKNCIYLGFINSAKSKDVRIFKSIYESMVKEMWGFPPEILEKAFNTACESETLDSLKFLDEKLNLTKFMMKQDKNFEFSNINFLLHEKYHQLRQYYYSSSQDSPTPTLDNTAKVPGFMLAATNGCDEVIQYLISQSEIIPQQLLETAFILASQNNHFSTMIIIDDYCMSSDDESILNFKKSPLIQSHIGNTSNKELENFFEKMILSDQLKSSLNDVKHPTTKKIKI